MPPRKKSAETANKAAQFQQASDLMDLFKMLYRKKYFKEASFNLIQTKYDISELITELGFYPLKELIEYYFQITVENPSMRNFLYGYEDLIEMKQERASDEIARKKLMEQTRLRVEAYKREQRG